MYKDKGVDDRIDKTHGATRNILGGCFECSRHCKTQCSRNNPGRLTHKW